MKEPGLDDRHRDKTPPKAGEIQQKRGDTLNKNLPEGLNQEDQIVPRGHETIHLSEDEHFYSAEDHKKGIKIVVNAREKTVHRHRLSYEQIVKLAYPTPPSENTIGYTVTFYKGHEDHHEGHLEAGESVRIHNGMIFNVTPINRS
jgi:hypothetical protein